MGPDIQEKGAECFWNYVSFRLGMVPSLNSESKNAYIEWFKTCDHPFSSSNMVKFQILWPRLLISCLNDQKKSKFDLCDFFRVQNLDKEQIEVPKHPISDFWARTFQTFPWSSALFGSIFKYKVWICSNWISAKQNRRKIWEKIE